jgi:hypothetical protein
MQRRGRDSHHQEPAIRIDQGMPLAADDALRGIAASRTVVDIAQIGFGFLLIVSMVPVAAYLSLPSRFPEQNAAAPFRLKRYVLTLASCSPWPASRARSSSCCPTCRLTC